MIAQLSSKVLAGPLEEGNDAFAESLRVLGATTHTGYSLITAQGVVIAEPMEETPGEVRSQLDQPEIALATREGFGVAEREGILHVATAIAPDGVVIGYARASIPSSRVSPELQELQARIIISGAVALLAAVLLSWLLAGRMVRRSEDLAPVMALVGTTGWKTSA